MDIQPTCELCGHPFKFGELVVPVQKVVMVRGHRAEETEMPSLRAHVSCALHGNDT